MIESFCIKNKAMKLGADIAGIAPIERFKELNRHVNPIYIKPDTKTVIVLGFKINRGAMRGVEETTAYGTLPAGSPTTPIHMRGITYNLCRWIETELHCEASSLLEQPGDCIDSEKDEALPNTISLFEYAANAAGLGEIGAGKLFLTPEFGPRQYFSIILTDAEIEPDRVFTDSICDKCGECIRACPHSAISSDEIETCKIAGRNAGWNRVSIEICLTCDEGAVDSQYGLTEPSRVGAACGRACIAHLEDCNMLKTIYKNKFRKG